MILSKLWNSESKYKEEIQFGLIVGLASGLAFGLASLVVGLATGLVVGLATGLVVGLATGLAFGLAAGLAVGLVAGLINLINISETYPMAFLPILFCILIIIALAEILFWLGRKEKVNVKNL